MTEKEGIRIGEGRKKDGRKTGEGREKEVRREGEEWKRRETDWRRAG